MRIDDLAVVIPAQQGGNDLIRNALAKFGSDETPLLTWKIRQLKHVVDSNHIYVSSYSEEVKALALTEGVNVHHRSKDLASESQGPFGDVIVDVIRDIPHKHVAWVSAVCPLMDERDYMLAFQCYFEIFGSGEYDSLMAVNRIYDYLWSDVQPLNYNCDSQQPRRLGLSPTYKVTNGLFMREREAILRERYYVGKKPYKFQVSKLSGLDINAQEDLEAVEALSALHQKQRCERDRVVFLDFDGVIFDSVVEAYAIALLTTQRIKRLDELDLSSEHSRRFMAQRYLIGPAWNYHYLLKSIDDGNDECFTDYLPSEPGASAKDFQAAFFATRQVIRNNFWQEWLALNRMYDGAEKFVEYINNSQNIVIVTTKDKTTVNALLQNHGLARDLEIFDAKTFEEYGGKANFMDDYIKRNHIREALFVDDSEQHLEKCSWVERLKVMQAKWGYVSHETREDNMLEVFNSIEGVLYG
ncbi:HAD family hydrolase [Pseudomaricurvus sp. HS19]|uniref:HAD family hydrolase n=1 Tax=Pseudomaricurvus sp. HS19 TaxID=2692626 RepID=UPI0013699BB2|nr:HAD family hydrolase [Pseudomaricurvus sp. HS19]MYM62864.1 hypothetical protein [Pseudomaricurvus sp. HS19]